MRHDVFLSLSVQCAWSSPAGGGLPAHAGLDPGSAAKRRGAAERDGPFCLQVPQGRRPHPQEAAPEKRSGSVP